MLRFYTLVFLPFFCFGLHIATDLKPVQMIISDIVFGSDSLVCLISKQESDVHDHGTGATPNGIIAARSADIFASAKVKKYKNLESGDVIDLLQIVDIKKDDKNSQPDLHFWLSPQNAVIIAEKLAQICCVLDPANSDLYVANKEKFKALLEQKIHQIKDDLSKQNIEAEKEYLVLHDAYRYFEDFFRIKRPVGSFYDSAHNIVDVETMESYKSKIKDQKISCMIASSANGKLVKVFENSIKIIKIDPLGIDIKNINGGYFKLLDQVYLSHVKCLN